MQMTAMRHTCLIASVLCSREVHLTGTAPEAVLSYRAVDHQGATLFEKRDRIGDGSKALWKLQGSFQKLTCGFVFSMSSSEQNIIESPW